MRYTSRTEAKRQAEQAVLQAIRATFGNSRWHVSQLCEAPGTAPAVRVLCDTYEWALVTPTHVGRALHQMVGAGAPLKRDGRGGAIFWSLIESPAETTVTSKPETTVTNTTKPETTSKPGRRPSARFQESP